MTRVPTSTSAFLATITWAKFHYSIYPCPRAPSYLNSSLPGYVTIGCIEPRTHHLGTWESQGCIH